MNEISFQKVNGVPCPYSKEDQDLWDEYPENGITRHKVSGTRKARSLQQLKAYFGCCRQVAAHTSNPDFNTANKTDLQLRIKLGWIEDTIVVQGRVQFVPKSISYKVMKHLEACNYFSRSFDIMADALGVSVEDMLKNHETENG